MALFTRTFFTSARTSIITGQVSQANDQSSHLRTNAVSLRTLPTRSISVDQPNVSTPLKFDHLTQNPCVSDESRIQHANKLEMFKQIFKKLAREDPFEVLAMIDAIQRLGIDHYFQDEIERVLEKQSMLFCTNGGHGRHLHKVALCFRLLRQEGHYVPAGVFDEFKNREESFSHKQSTDIRGLMELYEASQLSIEGEDMLDEIGESSAQQLKAWLTQVDQVDPSYAMVVRNTLHRPCHKSLSRFGATNLISDYKGNNGWIYVLQELAKMDFNMVQSLHQNEILEISRWWKDLGLAKELEFARDQPIKWHTWSIACLTDPSLSKERIELTKPISLIYIIDDVYDVYGTLDELTLFTEVVDRWDYAAIDQLPGYMKICFKALYDITNEISHKVQKEHGWNPIDSLRKSWARLCNAFLVEAQWFASGEVPNPEEYLRNAIVSSGVHIVLVHIFFLLGQNINQESVDLIDSSPGIISSPATILRLWDDLGSAKDENQEGNDGSYVACYMKQHQGIAMETARKHVFHMVSKAWKRLNQECLNPNPFSSHFTKASLNLARMVPLMYSYDEKHRLPILQEYMNSLLYQNKN